MRRVRELWWAYAPVYVALAFLVAVAGLIGGIIVGVNHSMHVECLRIHEQSDLPTRVSHRMGECWIQVNGEWVPIDRWRILED